MEKPMIDCIKEMSSLELTEWLFNFGLNCVGMSKGDIYRMLNRDKDYKDNTIAVWKNERQYMDCWR